MLSWVSSPFLYPAAMRSPTVCHQSPDSPRARCRSPSARQAIIRDSASSRVGRLKATPHPPHWQIAASTPPRYPCWTSCGGPRRHVPANSGASSGAIRRPGGIQRLLALSRGSWGDPWADDSPERVRRPGAPRSNGSKAPGVVPSSSGQGEAESDRPLNIGRSRVAGAAGRLDEVRLVSAEVIHILARPDLDRLTPECRVFTHDLLLYPPIRYTTTHHASTPATMTRAARRSRQITAAPPGVELHAPPASPHSVSPLTPVVPRLSALPLGNDRQGTSPASPPRSPGAPPDAPQGNPNSRGRSRIAYTTVQSNR